MGTEGTRLGVGEDKLIEGEISTLKLEDEKSAMVLLIFFLGGGTSKISRSSPLFKWNVVLF